MMLGGKLIVTRVALDLSRIDVVVGNYLVTPDSPELTYEVVVDVGN